MIQRFWDAGAKTYWLIYVILGIKSQTEVRNSEILYINDLIFRNRHWSKLEEFLEF